jgi:hypothetical protein
MATDAPDDRTFVCPHCGRPARATIVGVAVWSGRLPDGSMVSPPTEWAMVQCQRCSIPSVQVREDYGYGSGFDEDEPLIVFPAPQRMSPSIPTPLRQ